MCYYSACTTIVHSAQDQGWQGSLYLVPSLYPSYADITADAIFSPVVTVEPLAPGTEDKDTLDINLITTRP